MRKGVTLIGLMIVIIILGILASLAVKEYARNIEKSRSAEARDVLGSIRRDESSVWIETGSTTTNDAQVGIGLDYPGPDPADCSPTHWFYYDITAAAGNSFTARANRCEAGGKNPNIEAGSNAWIQLQSDLSTGVDTWTKSGHY